MSTSSVERSGSRSASRSGTVRCRSSVCTTMLVATLAQQFGPLQGEVELLLHLVAEVQHADEADHEAMSGHDSTDQSVQRAAAVTGSSAMNGSAESAAVCPPSCAPPGRGGPGRPRPADRCGRCAASACPRRSSRARRPRATAVPPGSGSEWARLGRVRKSEPLAFSMVGSKGGTGPLDWPNSTIRPRGRSDVRGSSRRWTRPPNRRPRPRRGRR